MTTKRGGVKIFEGRVYARVRFGKNERLEERLPWATPADRAAAEERSAAIGEICDVLLECGRRDLIRTTAKHAAAATSPQKLETIRKAVAAIAKGRAALPESHLTTFGDVAKDWTSGELRKKYPDHVRYKADFRIEVARLKRYILPLLKDVPIVAFEKGHGDMVMASLPPKRIKTQGARRHIAQIIARILHLSVMPLGLIKQTPLPRGWLPRIEERRHYTCLFPREEAQYLRCAQVPEVERLFFGLLDREGMRVSELADAEWWQFNLVEGTFTATKRKKGDPTMWAMRPDSTRALRIWKERHGKTKARPFIDLVPDENAKPYLAAKLRDGLKKAGVERAELFESTAYTGQMRAHDLRATFVTVSIVAGKSEAWIRDRTGHKSTAMIDRYRRTARQFEELKLGELVDLVDAMGWGISRVILATGTDGGGEKSSEETEGSGAGIRTPIRGSKILEGSSSVEGVTANADGSSAADGGSRRGITQGSPTLLRLAEGLAMERVQWDVLERELEAYAQEDDDGRTA